MLRILHGLEGGHWTFGLIFLIFLVLVATPILKHMLFRRARGGSVYLPHAKAGFTPAQMREARQLLQENKRKEKLMGGRPSDPSGD